MKHAAFKDSDLSDKFSNLFLEDIQFESRPYTDNHKWGFTWFPSVPPLKFQDITSNWDTTASFHTLSYLVIIKNPPNRF
jgi:hypothetical protein